MFLVQQWQPVMGGALRACAGLLAIDVRGLISALIQSSGFLDRNLDLNARFLQDRCSSLASWAAESQVASPSVAASEPEATRHTG